MRMLLCILSMFIVPCIALGGANVYITPVTKFVAVTPVIQAAAYSSGDQLGSKFKVSGLLDKDTRDGLLISASLVDLDAQSAQIQFWFFSQEPQTVAGDNAAFSISDADMAYSLGTLDMTAYATSAANSVAINTVIFQGLHSTAQVGGSYTGDIWVVMKSLGTPTYTTTSSLSLRFFVQ